MLPAHRTSLVLGAGAQIGQVSLETENKSHSNIGVLGQWATLRAVTQISRIRLGLSSGLPYALSGQSQQSPDYF